MTAMKLAQALQERADLNARIGQLRQRISHNALVQEGEKPAEDPQKLLVELNACFDRLQALTARVNLTNAQTRVGKLTLTELIAEKDTLTSRIRAYRDLAAAASQTSSRARGAEIRILSAVSVTGVQAEADRLSQRLREVNSLIQEHNWLTELL